MFTLKRQTPKPLRTRRDIATRFKPGVSGNPGGRPRAIYEATAKALAEIDPLTGKTRADKIVESMLQAAERPMMPHSVSAFRAIREVAEPMEEAESGQINANVLNATVIAILTEAAGERQANAIEI
jgi:hypothetical protein